MDLYLTWAEQEHHHCISQFGYFDDSPCWTDVFSVQKNQLLVQDHSTEQIILLANKRDTERINKDLEYSRKLGNYPYSKCLYFIGRLLKEIYCRIMSKAKTTKMDVVKKILLVIFVSCQVTQQWLALGNYVLYFYLNFFTHSMTMIRFFHTPKSARYEQCWAKLCGALQVSALKARQPQLGHSY